MKFSGIGRAIVSNTRDRDSTLVKPLPAEAKFDLELAKVFTESWMR